MTTTNNTTLSQEEIKEIVNMYKNNFSIRKISEITHYSRPKLTKLLEQTGVKTNKGNHYRKYFFNFDFFETIVDSKYNTFNDLLMKYSENWGI